VRCPRICDSGIKYRLPIASRRDPLKAALGSVRTHSCERNNVLPIIKLPMSSIGVFVS